MAKVQVQMPDEFLGKISKLGKHTDEITERALQAGAKVVEAQFRTNLSSSIGQGSVFSDKAPDEYIVVVPLTENFDYFADNQPQVDIHEARISIFTKGNYLSIKNAVVKRS